MVKSFIFNELGYFIQNADARIDLFIEAKKGRALDFCSDGIIKDGLTYYDPDDKDVDKLRQQIDDHLAKNKVVLMPSLRTPLSLTLKERLSFPIMSRILERINREKNISGRSAVILKIRRF